MPSNHHPRSPNRTNVSHHLLSPIPPKNESESLDHFKRLLQTKQQHSGLDQETLDLLRNQLAHIKHIKQDNETKSKIIQELHEHVQQLLQYKDEAFQLRAQLRQRQDDYQVEVSKMNHEMLSARDETSRHARILHQLKDELTRKNTEVITLKEEHHRKMETINLRLQQVNEDFDRLQQENHRLSTSVQEWEVTNRQQQESLNKYEKESKSVVNGLNQELSDINRNRNQLQMQLQDVESQLRNANRTIDDQRNSISHLSNEVNKLDRVKLQQSNSLKDAESRLAEKDREIHSLSIEANKVPVLRNELEIIPVLRGEIDKLRNEVTSLTGENTELTNTVRALRNKGDQMERNYSELNSHCEELSQLNASLKYDLDALKDVEVQKQFLQNQCDHLKNETEAYKHEIQSLKLSESNKDSDIHKDLDTIRGDLQNLQKMIDHVVSGGVLSESLFNVPLQKLLYLNSVSSSLSGVKGQIVESLNLIGDIRGRNRKLDQLVDEHADMISKKESELADSYAKLLASNDKSEEQSKQLKSLRNELEDTKKELLDVSQKFESFVLEEKRRKELVITLFDKLSSASDKQFPSNEALSASWENLQNLYSDQVLAAVMTKESLSKDLNILRVQVEDAENLYKKTKNQLSESWEQSEKEKSEMERIKNQEMDELRENYENQKQQITDELTAKRDELQRELSIIREQYSDLEMKHKKSTLLNEMLNKDLKSSNEERKKFQNNLRLLARSIRPLRKKIQSLIWQKKFLTQQLDKKTKDFNESVKVIQSLNEEFRVLDENIPPFVVPQRKTMRVFSIAVVAFNRLLKTKKKTPSLVKHVGQEVVSLVDDSEISQTTDLPTSSQESHALENYIQLCRVLDPEMDRFQPHDSVLLRSLNSGCDYMQLRCGNIGKSIKSVFDNVKDTQHGVIQVVRNLNNTKNKLQREYEDAERERNRLTLKSQDLDQALLKKQELVNTLDLRVQSLEFENSQLIPPQKYHSLQNESDRIKSDNITLRHDREQLKQELEEQMKKMSNLRTDSQLINDKIRENQYTIDQLKRELGRKDEETKKLQGVIRRQTTDLIDLAQEKKKYQYMVSELSTKNLLNQSSPRRFAESAKVETHLRTDDSHLRTETSHIRDDSYVRGRSMTPRNHPSPITPAHSPFSPAQRGGSPGNRFSLLGNKISSPTRSSPLRKPNELYASVLQKSHDYSFKKDVDMRNSELKRSVGPSLQSGMHLSPHRHVSPLRRNSPRRLSASGGIKPLFASLQESANDLDSANRQAQSEMQELDAQLETARKNLLSLSKFNSSYQSQ